MTYKDNIRYNKSGASSVGQQTCQLKCENVEMLGSMNRYANFNGHRTNLYSIVVNTDILKCISPGADKIKQTLKKEIQHATRSIIEKLAPVNTQLLSVFINDI